MLLRFILLFSLLLVIGCGKDESAPPVRIIVDVPEPKPKSVVSAPKDLGNENDTVAKQKAPKEDTRARLEPCDLSNFGVYAQIDAPVGAKPRQDPSTASLEINGNDGYSLSVKRGQADLAQIKREAMKNPQARVLIDEADGLLVQKLEAGSPRFEFYVNVKIADEDFQVEKQDDPTATAGQVRRNFNAARTLRQTPDLKSKKAFHDLALVELQAAGAVISTVPDGTNTLQISVLGATQITEAHLKLLRFLPEVSEMDLRTISRLSPGAA